MGHRDPERARQANVKKQANFRQRKREEKLAPDEAPVPRTQSATPDEPAAGMNHRKWATRKVQIGQKLCSVAVKAIEAASKGSTTLIGVRDAAQMLRLGVDMINANLSLSQQTTTVGPEPGSVQDVDRKFLFDAEYLELAEKLLIRKSQIQLEIDAREKC